MITRTTMNKQPKGKLTYLRTEIRENTHALYIDVYFKDENGDEWFTSSSAFKFDLKEVLNLHE